MSIQYLLLLSSICNRTLSSDIISCKTEPYPVFKNDATFQYRVSYPTEYIKVLTVLRFVIKLKKQYLNMFIRLGITTISSGQALERLLLKVIFSIDQRVMKNICTFIGCSQY